VIKVIVHYPGSLIPVDKTTAHIDNSGGMTIQTKSGVNLYVAATESFNVRFVPPDFFPETSYEPNWEMVFHSSYPYVRVENKRATDKVSFAGKGADEIFK